MLFMHNNSNIKHIVKLFNYRVAQKSKSQSRVIINLY